MSRIYAFVALSLAVVGCASQTAETTDGTADTGTSEAADTAGGVSQGVGTVAPQAAAAAAGFTEVARGYVSQIKNSPTYNNPTGGIIKVHLQGCSLSTLSLGLLDSNSQPVYDLRNAGSVTNFDGTYDMYWSMSGRNLGFATLYSWGVGNCYATISQSDAGSFPPPPPPPPPPASCSSQFNQWSCQATPGCVAMFQTVYVPAFPVGYYANQFAYCAAIAVPFH